jgi:phage protein U
MLLSIGPLVFDIAPFNAREISHQAAEDFARHDVIGAMRPHEHVGPGDESWSISAVLFPEKFGGLSSLDVLHALRKAAVPQLMVRGDGAALGFVLVTAVSETSIYLDAGGVGRMIEVEITLEASAQPSAAILFEQLYNLFS